MKNAKEVETPIEATHRLIGRTSHFAGLAKTLRGQSLMVPLEYLKEVKTALQALVDRQQHEANTAAIEAALTLRNFPEGDPDEDRGPR